MNDNPLNDVRYWFPQGARRAGAICAMRLGNRQEQTVDAGYCLDAPEYIPTGAEDYLGGYINRD